MKGCLGIIKSRFLNSSQCRVIIRITTFATVTHSSMIFRWLWSWPGRTACSTYFYWHRRQTKRKSAPSPSSIFQPPSRFHYYSNFADACGNYARMKNRWIIVFNVYTPRLGPSYYYELLPDQRLWSDRSCVKVDSGCPTQAFQLKLAHPRANICDVCASGAIN